MNEFHKLLNKTVEEFDSAESEPAPSGEWEEYNLHIVRLEARWYGMDDLAEAVGTCGKCEHRGDSHIDNYCRDNWCSVLNIKMPNDDGYCNHFKRKTDEQK